MRLFKEIQKKAAKGKKYMFAKKKKSVMATEAESCLTFVIIFIGR